MRVTAYSILLFFVCLNVSLYLLAETEVLPYYQPAYESPSDITTRLVGSLTILTVGALVAFVVGNWLVGAAALALFALNLLVPVFSWIFFGFPNFLTQLASATGDSALVLTVTGSMNALMAVVWFWFLIGFISQRTMEV